MKSETDTLFLPGYYRKQLGPSCADASVSHYRNIGWKLGLDPHPFFRTAFYRSRHLDKHADTALCPLDHFLARAASDFSLNPSPLFHSSWYARQAGLTEDSGVIPLLHYLEGGSDSLSPSPLFDPTHGLPGWMLPGQRPLMRHILRPSWFPGNRWFNRRLYAKWHPDFAHSRMTALEHWASRPEHAARLFRLDWFLSRKDTGEQWNGVRRQTRPAVRHVVFGGNPHTAPDDEIYLLDGRESDGATSISVPTDTAGLALLTRSLMSQHKEVLFHQPDENQESILAALAGEFGTSTESVPAGNDRPQILFLCQNWNLSGVNRWVQRLSEHLSARGWPVRVILTENPVPLEHEHDLPRVPVEIAPHTPKIFQSLWESTRDLITSAVPCVVFTAYEWNANGIAPALPPEARFVNVLHSDEPRYYEQALRLAPYADALVAVSTRIRDELVTRAETTRQKTRLIPYGIRIPDAQAFPVSGDKPIRLLYTGRLARRQKRALDFIPLVRELALRNVPFHLTLAGDGHDAAKLRRRLRKEVKAGLVTFTGHVDESTVSRLLLESQIFVLMSDFEGLPLSLLEAMAHGVVPVVSAIASGVPDVIEEGVTGFTCPIGQISAFADRIAELSRSPDQWQRMSQAAKRKIRGEFSVETMGERYEHLLEEILSTPPNRPVGELTPLGHVLPEKPETIHPDRRNHPSWFRG